MQLPSVKKPLCVLLDQLCKRPHPFGPNGPFLYNKANFRYIRVIRAQFEIKVLKKIHVFLNLFDVQPEIQKSAFLKILAIERDCGRLECDRLVFYCILNYIF